MQLKSISKFMHTFSCIAVTGFIPSFIFLLLHVSAYKVFKNIDPLSGFQNNKKGRIAFTAVADNVDELKVMN